MLMKTFRIAAAICVIFALTAPATSFAGGRSKISWLEPRIPQAQIACYHKKAHRYSAELHPEDCLITGTRGRERRFVVFPMQGMKWGHWGAGRTRAAYGVSAISGNRLSVIAYRRIECGGGSIWYSEVIILNPESGNYFGIHPPICLR
jgi:hypothetical protein